uniref:pelargonidin 3-O-(6-caffeoylglucoside) 5-O-(6-O-malonylglucoside) 4'''-malonyltransferase-like n=1 Tax=Erigeron canadensis TaxID=72917 RepID=UPI001CB9CC30|nr:pelargonidin 3-O-(6-caffeoylglucoside) 5-O-(6-O-malonylglucoside) 4'''-malonyltransferase-like [Erigeron canadensis]
MIIEVENFVSKHVKPSIPTSTINRYYTISFLDELAPTLNVPLILYYSAPSNSLNGLFGNTICDHLEDTLSKTLIEFYPFAGRYIRKLSLIDCNDQGVLYVLGKVNIRLSDILSLGETLDPGLLNNFLPCEIGQADEVDDPLLSIKVTTFKCGGFAIGMCVSHRISDMANTCNFVNSWAARSNGELKNESHSPIFNSTVWFPQRGLAQLDLRIPRSSVGINKVARRFIFKKEAVSAMRQNFGLDTNGSCRPSRVQLIVALMWKAIVRIDQATNGRSKASFLIQPVELRKKVVPPLPTNSFGNFWGLAASKLKPGEGDKMSFRDFLTICHDSVKKTSRDCAKILTHGEEGYKIVIDPFLESTRNMEDINVNFYLFTSWCNFSYYKANFGFGKPIWATPGKLPAQNSMLMMDGCEGDSIEAWVHLDKKRMNELEQDPDIKAYAI